MDLANLQSMPQGVPACLSCSDHRSSEAGVTVTGPASALPTIRARVRRADGEHDQADRTSLILTISLRENRRIGAPHVLVPQLV
jgi:hypothetical protein